MEWKWESNYLYLKSNYRLTWSNEGWNLWHIGKETVGLIATENCGMIAKTAQAWADKIIAEREGTMDLDKIKAELKAEVWQEITSRIKAVHDRETCETTRKVLKEIMGVGYQPPDPLNGYVYISSRLEALVAACTQKGHFVSYLSPQRSYDEWDEVAAKYQFRPMRPGTVLLTIGEGGKIKKSVVKEDYP